jgi:hypothetical protein
VAVWPVRGPDVKVSLYEPGTICEVQLPSAFTV